MSKQSNANEPAIEVSAGKALERKPTPTEIPNKKHRKREPEVTIAPTSPGGPDVTIS